VRTADVERLRAAFADVTREAHATAAPPLLVDAALGAELPIPSLGDLHRLEPTGMANDAPRFALRAAVMDARAVGEGAHLKLTLRVGARYLSAFGPAMGGLRDDLPAELVAVGSLRADAYRGGDAIELHIEHLELSDP
jgi:single-stranded-DNA-specific exonuclease